jgi:hypothetical protein
MSFYNYIKEKTSDLRQKIWHSKKTTYRLIRLFYAPIHFCRMFAFSAEYRGQFFAYLKYRKHYHQVPNFTKYNRYPSLFIICKEHFKDKENLRILSFGCSTGEEVFTLNEYMPKAEIVGTDISPYNLKQCNKKPKSASISFVHSLSEEFLRSENFDAIFALAVLQHEGNRHEGVTVATQYTFEHFEEQVVALDKKLNTGGLLFIDQSDFNFLETKLRLNYFHLAVEGNKAKNNRPLFNSSNKKVADRNDCYRVFLKK